MWKYPINGMRNVFHVSEWPIYKDWLSICFSGDVSDMESFHKSFLKQLNSELNQESLSYKQNVHKRPFEFYDSGWNQRLVLNYDPYLKLLTCSAREVISSGKAPAACVAWFAANRNIDKEQIIYALDTLLIRGDLRNAFIVLALFPDLPFQEVFIKESEFRIFPTVLQTNDIGLIHEMWSRGTLDEASRKICDSLVLKGTLNTNTMVFVVS